MIKVERLKSHEEYILNAELIETIEETPDTVITLTSGRKLLVEESMDELVRKIMDYRRAILGKFR
jgi:flagellar protein FlbD